MKNTLKTRYEARAKIIKAMAHPSRLLIIEELNKGALRRRTHRNDRRGRFDRIQAFEYFEKCGSGER